MSSTNRGMYWRESGVSLQDRSTLRLGLIYVLTLYIPSAQCRPGSQRALSVFVDGLHAPEIVTEPHHAQNPGIPVRQGPVSSPLY